jgi:hypothetical protein
MPGRFELAGVSCHHIFRVIRAVARDLVLIARRPGSESRHPDEDSSPRPLPGCTHVRTRAGGHPN